MKLTTLSLKTSILKAAILEEWSALRRLPSYTTTEDVVVYSPVRTILKAASEKTGTYSCAAAADQVPGSTQLARRPLVQ